MSIITLIILILLIAAGFWANNTYVGPGLVRTLFNIVLMIVTIVIILSVAGVLGGASNVGNYRVGR
jgi:hypothetical protein